jgi:hypothetical protein
LETVLRVVVTDGADMLIESEDLLYADEAAFGSFQRIGAISVGLMTILCGQAHNLSIAELHFG